MALSFSELVKAYLAVIPDNTDYHTRKFMDVFGEQSAWEISPADLSRAAQAMIEAGYN